MIYIDTHCHLYADEFKDDINEVIAIAQKASVQKFYLPAIDSSTHEKMIAVENQFPDSCMAMMGLHPCSVNETVQVELNIIEEWLIKRKFVAIGEIGLDFYWDKTFTEQQYIAFEVQMQLALEQQLPIVIHTRNAMQETINMVKPFAQKGLNGIFHCFSGSYENAKQIVDIGFYLGIGGVITYKNAGLPQVLQNIGLENMVLETDAPYLSPVPFRGKRNQSSYIPIIAQKLADTKNCTIEDVARITSQNAKKIFNS